MADVCLFLCIHISMLFMFYGAAHSYDERQSLSVQRHTHIQTISPFAFSFSPSVISRCRFRWEHNFALRRMRTTHLLASSIAHRCISYHKCALKWWMARRSVPVLPMLLLLVLPLCKMKCWILVYYYWNLFHFAVVFFLGEATERYAVAIRCSFDDGRWRIKSHLH